MSLYLFVVYERLFIILGAFQKPKEIMQNLVHVRKGQWRS